VTGEKRFETAALSAIDYERSLFSPEFGNWVDLRNLESPGFNGKGSAHDFVTAWCHGAPGIGIARLTSLPFLNDSAIQQEIAVALKTAIARGFGASHCLCHGDLGSLELLLQASRKFDDPQLRLQLDRMIGMVIGSIDRDGWLCGAPMNLQPPGLMTGIAGIGYELLRLAEPASLPSALSLDSPYD
jgi:lantibiotic modifying enzyme